MVKKTSTLTSKRSKNDSVKCVENGCDKNTAHVMKMKKSTVKIHSIHEMGLINYCTVILNLIKIISHTV